MPVGNPNIRSHHLSCCVPCISPPPTTAAGAAAQPVVIEIKKLLQEHPSFLTAAKYCFSPFSVRQPNANLWQFSWQHRFHSQAGLPSFICSKVHKEDFLYGQHLSKWHLHTRPFEYFSHLQVGGTVGLESLEKPLLVHTSQLFPSMQFLMEQFRYALAADCCTFTVFFTEFTMLWTCTLAFSSSVLA